MASVFSFRRLSANFLSEVLNNIDCARFTVILGPPYSGKTLFLRQLAQKLQHRRPVVFNFQTESPTRSDKDVRRCVALAITETLGLRPPIDEHDRSVISMLQTAVQQVGSPLVMLIGSIDGLSYHLCRRLLTELNDLWEQRLILPVLSGESGLLDLVHGPSSALSLPTLYMNQGFDPEAFKLVAARYMDLARNLGFRFGPDVEDKLFEETGGNDSLVGWIFWDLLEGGLRQSPATQELGAEDIERIATKVAKKGVRGAHTFIRADWLLTRKPQCWRDLEKLSQLDGVPIPQGCPPGPLEFSGLAIRNGASLEAASPMVKTFIANHYTPLHLADLAARSGHWDEAFERYKSLGQVLPRPTDIVDWREAASNLAAFSSFIRSLTTDYPTLVHAFMAGCKYLLGLREILYFERKDFELWQLHPVWSTATSKPEENHVQSVLPTGVCELGEYRLPIEYEPSGLAWVMGGERDERQVLILVSDGLEERRAMGPERRSLAKQLLQGFAAAHDEAKTAERDQALKLLQISYAEIFQKLVVAMSQAQLSVKELVTACAKEIKALRYRRVLFSLVSPDRTKIVGFHDECDDSSVKVDSMTDWMLALPARDLQPWVVVNKNFVRVPDATREPMANQRVVSMARIRSLAIVPIIVAEGDQSVVPGTIHVERSDGLVPSRSEVECLQDFARQFGRLLRLQENLIQLEAVVRNSDCAVVVCSPTLQYCYMNNSAAGLLNIDSGTFGHHGAIGNKRLREHLEAACTGREREQRWIDEDGNLTEHMLLTKMIVDSDRRLLGAVAYFTPFEVKAQPTQILCRIARSQRLDDAYVLAINFTKSLERRWARLWRIRTQSRFEYFAGFDETSSESAGTGLGLVELSPRGTRSFESWECIEKRQPIVLKYDPDGITGATGTSIGGTPYSVISSCCCPSELAKGPGEYWLDLPLISAQGEALAKVTVQWTEHDPMELFELASCLTDIFGARSWSE